MDWTTSDELFRVCSMHTQRLMEAVRLKRPFSIWRSGRLFGFTYNETKA